MALQSCRLKDGDPKCAIGRRPEGFAPERSRARSALGAYFAEVAELEAASVFAFERLTRELVAHDAPGAIVASARAAARDEVRHTKVTSELAARFGAKSRAPAIETRRRAEPLRDRRRRLRARDVRSARSDIPGEERERPANSSRDATDRRGRDAARRPGVAGRCVDRAAPLRSTAQKTLRSSFAKSNIRSIALARTHNRLIRHQSFDGGRLYALQACRLRTAIRNAPLGRQPRALRPCGAARPRRSAPTSRRWRS